MKYFFCIYKKKFIKNQYQIFNPSKSVNGNAERLFDIEVITP